MKVRGGGVEGTRDQHEIKFTKYFISQAIERLGNIIYIYSDSVFIEVGGG